MRGGGGGTAAVRPQLLGDRLRLLLLLVRLDRFVNDHVSRVVFVEMMLFGGHNVMDNVVQASRLGPAAGWGRRRLGW